MNIVRCIHHSYVSGLISYGLVRRKPLPPVTAEQGTLEKSKLESNSCSGIKSFWRPSHRYVCCIVWWSGCHAACFRHKNFACWHPDGFGLLRAAPSIGAAAMAIYLTQIPSKNIGKIFIVVRGRIWHVYDWLWAFYFLLAFIYAYWQRHFWLRECNHSRPLIHTLTPENMKGRVKSRIV